MTRKLKGKYPWFGDNAASYYSVDPSHMWGVFLYECADHHGGDWIERIESGEINFIVLLNHEECRLIQSKYYDAIDSGNPCHVLVMLKTGVQKVGYISLFTLNGFRMWRDDE